MIVNKTILERKEEREHTSPCAYSIITGKKLFLFS